MQVDRQQSGVKGMFYVGSAESPNAAMLYRVDGKKNIIIEHTEVGESLKGMNAGIELVSAAVAYARENNIKILALCPYAKSVFKKRPEFSDVYIKL
ncbi:MAG TPA: GNAT family N-acetyltransferase [Panacibacter sp.]|nr:GNAT family N-acetyltransferase [Panacibacter sp.]HNP45686.1 GNAT family N-acetyltransferase [Panacibacter sp.]